MCSAQTHVNHRQLYAYTYPANRVGQAILMKFDLSQIPAGAVIESATLELSLVGVDPARRTRTTVCRSTRSSTAILT